MQADAGLYAALILRYLGARVIEIENPNGGDMTRTNPPYSDGLDYSVVSRSPEDFPLQQPSYRWAGLVRVNCYDHTGPGEASVLSGHL